MRSIVAKTRAPDTAAAGYTAGVLLTIMLVGVVGLGLIVVGLRVADV